MVTLICIHDLVAANGGTIRQNNLARQHQYSIGTLVEIKWDTWFGDGACRKIHARLWVVAHTRDCDGSPLYTLSAWRDPMIAIGSIDCYYSLCEESMTPIEITADVRDGADALAWGDDDA